MATAGGICTPYQISDTLPPGMIREAVKEAMAGRGWNLLKLAEESGVSYSTVHGWLADKGTGVRGPSVENVEKIMVVLGLSVRPAKPKKGGAGK